MVDIVYYDQILDLSGIEFTHSMRRRMTGIQQMVSDLLYKLKKVRPDLWEYINSYCSHIYHANTYGELDLSIKLAKAVKDRSFPLSPKDFQNSLYNIAMGYASIVTEFYGGYTCMSDSIMALDKSLYFATKMIDASIFKIAVVINTHGSKGFDNSGNFKAEIICLAEKDLFDSNILGTDFSSGLSRGLNTHDDSWIGSIDVKGRTAVDQVTGEGIETRWMV